MADPRDPDGSTRITGTGTDTGTVRGGTSHTPTAAGADVTGRMTGTGPATRADGSYAGTTTTDRGGHDHGHDERPHAYKTSAAAVFGLVFGLAALFCALTGILAPAAIVLGLIGLVVAVVGMKTSKRPGVTGHKVAVGGLVTALLGLLLGGAVTAGLAAVVNSNSQLDRISNKIDQLRSDLPSGQELKNKVK